MADYLLIDTYLGELRKETRTLRDAELIAEEVADHLLEAVEAKLRRGVDLLQAQQRALTEFGDPDLVGKAFASSRTGGATLPTQATRRAGQALLVSAVLWVVGLALVYAADISERSRPWDGLPQTLYTIAGLTLMAAGLVGAAGMLGVNRRHGGSLGLRGRIGALMILIAGITVFAIWAWGVWATALAVGAVLIGSGLIGSEIAPGLAGYSLCAGGVVGAVGLWGLQIADDGASLDEPVAQVILVSGMLLYVVGQVLLGLWMAGEEAFNEPEPIATA